MIIILLSLSLLLSLDRTEKRHQEDQDKGEEFKAFVKMKVAAFF